MSELAGKVCIPCQGGVPPLEKATCNNLLEDLGSEWNLVNVNDNAHHIEKDFTFSNFVEALAFVNRCGELAEEVGHHPNLYIHNYKYVKVEIWTHKIDGLVESDFILAAKIDKVS